MTSVQRSIANAILAGTPQARALALARATCQAVAQTQLSCEVCGVIHDQRRIVVIEQGEDAEQLQTLAACCSKCWTKTIRAKMQKACRDAPLWKTTWKGSERITSESDKTLEILHSAYTIAQILAHYAKRHASGKQLAIDAYRMHAANRIATDASIMIRDRTTKQYKEPAGSCIRWNTGRFERIVLEFFETPLEKTRPTAPTDRVRVEDYGKPSYGITDEEDNRHAVRSFECGLRIDERYYQTVLKHYGKQLQKWRRHATAPHLFALDKDGRIVAVIAAVEA